MSWYNSGIRHAISHAAKFVHHPPGWFAVAMPLFTSENQRYWAKKLGGERGARLYDQATQQVVKKALGPQGPMLLETYNQVVEDAANGHVDAQQILSHAPQMIRVVAASKRGPEVLHRELAHAHVGALEYEGTVIGSVGDDLKTGGKAALVFAGIFGAIFLVAGTGSAKRTAYDNHPAYRRIK